MSNQAATVGTEVPSSTKLSLTHLKRDIFSAPAGSVLIHACNAQGSWGSGIALAFRNSYPSAYQVYRSHCLTRHNPRTNPVRTGTCLLIPPCETKAGIPAHWIACLFTSAKYGKAKDPPSVILRNTKAAMKDLLRQVKTRMEAGKELGSLVMCRINSGKFAVKWGRTVDVLEGIVVEEGEASNVEVWSLDED
ncbi:uncharacterized protein EI97DRAFT_226615 [Westerdykella ornata]|uniref:ADP-ribose 1''-phosphate phosphatase n=1 Tax=Westerdykella ornata TaxID=318751 RepID=A0A6A6JR06_WESOR|nr:uncharacterized protein EI97DRAFT_226615 [Westerdykella ornata]KAF2279061.1 hypothetical protein EI97DRAFT_226615 [Westerdykella ornata]